MRSLPAAHQEPRQLARPLVGDADVQPAPDQYPEEASAELGLVHGGQGTAAGRTR